MSWCRASRNASWLGPIAAAVLLPLFGGCVTASVLPGPAAGDDFNLSAGEPDAVAYWSPDTSLSPKAKEGDERKRESDIEQIDHVAVRWFARTTGGAAEPQFITARELAFEARVESLTEGSAATASVPYAGKHVRAAIQRHVTEEILSQLPVQPAATAKQIRTYAAAAKRIMVEQIGGEELILRAARAEGIEPDEIEAILTRRAKASWYLDKMVAPMLSPSDLDLREAHRAGETPFTSERFDDVSEKVQRWYVATKLASALDRYYRGVRNRVQLKLIRR